MLTSAAGGLPPIVQTAELLMVCIEQAVRGFPRYHKYTLGGCAAKPCSRCALCTAPGATRRR